MVVRDGFRVSARHGATKLRDKPGRETVTKRGNGHIQWWVASGEVAGAMAGASTGTSTGVASGATYLGRGSLRIVHVSGSRPARGARLVERGSRGRGR